MTKLADKVPFIRVNHLWKDKKVLTNIFGESFVLKNDEFNQYASWELSENSALYKELDKKFFIKKDAEDFINTQIGEYQKRNKLNFIGPTLHIIVLTKWCNHQCKYCHAAADYRYTDDGLQMSKKTAEKTVDIILQSPNKSLTIEFQWWEPIANMAVIDHIIKYTEQQNKKTKKDINYALVSNLTMIDEEILEMLFSYPNLSISTSIDGDKKTHDFNRLIIWKWKNVSSFDEVANKIRLIRKWEKKK